MRVSDRNRKPFSFFGKSDPPKARAWLSVAVAADADVKDAVDVVIVCCAARAEMRICLPVLLLP